MPSIEVLPDDVSRLIAAGEVVERPASVVKELVENSLDAAAREITVEIDDGGRGRVAVTDDGCGMDREDLALAFGRHATSKIRSEADLAAVRTLGFRGEALPSIGAVADVEVWTRRHGSEAGWTIRVRGGAVGAVGEAGTAPGCRIEVRDIFFSTPARRKFLKSAATEASHVARIVGQIALSRPGVAFRLLHNGRETLSLPAGELRPRIRRLLGADVERRMTAIEAEGGIRLSGFATHPHLSLPAAKAISFVVNGRAVRDRALTHGLLNAYATLIPHGRYPAAVVIFDVDPADVDVNVHPAKLEVRFRRLPEVYQAFQRAVRGAFGRTAAAEPTPVYGLPPAKRADPGFAAMPLRLVSSTSSEASEEPAGGGRADEIPALFDRGGEFSSLRVVGQVFSGYLVCEGRGEVVLIDQHAAHERVAFERLREQHRTGAVERQRLLVPETVELAPGEAEVLVEARDDLVSLGLEVEPFGDRAILVRAVPALFGARAVAPLLQALAADLADARESRAVDHWREDVLSTIACHSVVRVGQALSEAEIRSLLLQLDGISLSTNCPHGRPVMASLSRPRLERLFGR